MNVEAMKEYASKMLEMILKSKDKEEFFIAYLDEEGIFTIPTADSQGNKVDSKYAKMEAIYDKYRREPNCKIDELLYNTLEKWCPIAKTSNALVGYLKVIEYQMGAEKENRAPFKMDCQYLLGLVKINLIGNKQIYDRPIYAEGNFWGKMQEYDRIFRGYGYHIMEQEQEANGPLDCISHKTETESVKTQNEKPSNSEVIKDVKENTQADLKPREQYAMELLRITLKYDILNSFLTGDGGYNLIIFDAMGNRINDYCLVMQTIYRKHKEDKSLELDKKVYEAIINILMNKFDEPLILNLLHVIEYQLMSEKQNTAPFKLDCEQIINEVRNNIERNKSRYIIKSSYRMWENLKNHNETIFLHYGYRIMKPEWVDEPETEPVKPKIDEGSSIPPKKANTAAVANTAKSGSEELQREKLETRSSDKITKLIKAIKKNCKKLWEDLSRK